MKLIRCLLATMILLGSVNAQGQTVRVDWIEVVGLRKTSDRVILQLLELEIGARVDTVDIERGVRRIRNTRLFTDVQYRLEERGDERVLIVHAKDRWTTIPIAKFNSGGGVQQLILGVYDPNIAGSYLEAGAQLERLEDMNSGVIWFKAPHLMGSRFSLNLQLWNTNRMRTFYDQKSSGPEEIDGYLQTRKQLVIILSHEVSEYLSWTAGVERHQDFFSLDYVTDEVIVARGAAPLPQNTDLAKFSLGLQLGRMDYGEYLVDGLQANIDSSIFEGTSSDRNKFVQMELGLHYSKTISGQHTFAQRFLWGRTDAQDQQYRFYLGGLDRIRGFVDNRFSSDNFWLSNTEFRYLTARWTHILLQGTVFTDILSTAEGGEGDGVTAASAGFGLRFIAPRIYRFVGRIDYAATLRKTDEQHVSFGVQQFF
ncbi:BamA/TamA family outer membrane protein [Pseudobacteriovorax antillogorgiicola]|uniref:Surface antigen n=1 Tax=Pseudobacteriovorax antillogorgiicola TaxID=1513793 RepID=A0A1Y6BSX3_9BACT|nr:BamA/TamA family outer membrane protein [Pseudobacteriovorax antillogorgiicola]TCS53145.1 surface antigen-like protein [Pseudobacteriovorax antillogorgiicola]SMF25239.1 Surface antigen [Pseudobacteriovorax antillogorgiicola]